MASSPLSRMLGVIGAMSRALDLVSDRLPIPEIPWQMLLFGLSQVVKVMALRTVVRHDTTPTVGIAMLFSQPPKPVLGSR